MEKTENMLENDSTQEAKDTLKVYEVSFLLVPTLPEEKIGEEFSAIKSIVEKQGGIFISEDFPKRRSLAYEMTKVIDTKRERYNEGYFGWVKFEVNSASLKDIKKALEDHKNVLRFLLINTVRENTLYVPRVSTMKKEGDDTVSDENGVLLAPEKSIASPEEIDKSIEALVI